jgi:hypothetical protein
MDGRQLSDRNQGSATLDPPGTRVPEGLIAAAAAAVAFLCYHATLLPGLDLGDSASLQTGVGSLILTPRQAYPLYYGLGSLFVWLHPGEPARALNLASAAYGAGAVALATLLTSRITGSRIAGLASGLFLAFSFTFWSQAITAEVYTLHLLIVGAALLALLAWSERQTPGRLALFYAIYALGFGNHLSMVLLLPALAAFLLVQRRPGAADPLRLRMIALATGIAAAAALQYAWNFRGLWAALEPPASFADALGQFWFDVTKADWRETLVMNVSETGLQARPAMYWFDLRQQFGVPGVLLAAIGIAFVLARWPSRGLLLLLIYLANLLFAWTYNVGDAYIFFLPSHYVLALCAGAGVTAVASGMSRISDRRIAAVVGGLCLLYPAWRGYDTFPAVDRSWDDRAIALLEEFTAPPSPGVHPQPVQNAVYGVDTNWQVQNAFEYFMRERKPGIPWFTTEELLWLEKGNVTERVRNFAETNRQMGRDIILAPGAYSKLEALGYNPSFATGETGIFREIPAPQDALTVRAMGIRDGTPYALAILRPDREFPLDKWALASGWSRLTGGSPPLPELRQFTIALGRVGSPPLLIRSEDRPYRLRLRIDPFDFDVRMESWLPTDTIRRAGFGQVIVDRRHLLTLERGVSFAALGPGGAPVYLSGLFASIPRYTWGMAGLQ